MMLWSGGLIKEIDVEIGTFDENAPLALWRCKADPSDLIASFLLDDNVVDRKLYRDIWRWYSVVP